MYLFISRYFLLKYQPSVMTPLNVDTLREKKLQNQIRFILCTVN